MTASLHVLLRQLLLACILLSASAASAQVDADADGFETPIDCDDGNPDIYPGAFEFCDGVDNNCDGQIDEELQPVFADNDGDGFGDPNIILPCTAPGVTNNLDCDDTNSAIHPGAVELIDGIDNNCNGQIDEPPCNDLDGDGTTDCDGDCDDNDPSVFPGSPELCGDGLDNDCNGTIDDQTTWYEDADSDGFGTAASTLLACDQPPGYVLSSSDCDDTNAGVYPLAGPGIGCASCSLADQQYIQEQYSEIWNITGLTISDMTPGLTGQAAWNALVGGLQPFLSAISPSCRQCVVERAYCAYLSCATECIPWQLIGPGDTYPGTPTCNQCVALGGCNATFNACVGVIDQDGDGYLSTNDCNDLDPAVNLGATELCDGIDNDCDGILDNFPLVFADTDGDGYGDPNALVMCATPGSVANNTDCDDTNAAIHPNAAELIDGIDNDCDGQVDEIQCNDNDGDGITDCDGDCNDNDPSVFPGAPELCGDGLDNDCNGTIDDQTTWYEDTDGDGFGTESNTLLACEQPAGYSPNPGDCDDTNNGVYPLAGPGIGCASCSLEDQQYIQEQYSQIWNLTGLTMSNTPPGLTGQAAWNAMLSGLQPFLTAIAPSCRQCVVERAFCAYTSCATACVPWQLIGTGGTYPGTPTCNQCVALAGCNVAFNACVGLIDQDGDGYLSTNDCNDLDPAINPGVEQELCDGIDNDCNGQIDEQFTPVFADSDGDGFGDPNAPVMCATPGSVPNNSDCDDTNAAIHPNAAELIDGIDNDCDGQVDEVQCNDNDGDGITDCDGDCDDNNPSVFPGAAEVCNDGLDNDCNGTVDDQTTWYEDADGDGFGSESNTLLACEQPIGYAPNPGDCDEANAGVYPLAGPGIGCSSCSAADRQWIADNYVEVWDHVGQAVVESHGASPNTAWNSLRDYLQLFLPIAPSCQQCVVERAYCLFISCSDQCFPYEIVDHPLVGDGSPECHQCAVANGCNSSFAACVGLVDQDGDGVLNTADCDDTDASVYGDAPELCDGIDNNCDGQIDEGVLVTWFADLDGDGFGDNATGVSQCTAPPGFVDIGNDCDDTNTAIHPGLSEVCNGIDDDCSGAADDVLAYADLDGDGFGDINNQVDCSFPGAVVNNGDCDDTDPSISPGALDACLNGDGIDNDCNGQIDEDGPPVFADSDGDGYGDPNGPVPCGTVGAVIDNGDCNDNNGTVYPGAPELCDNLDNDCDGLEDEEFYWYTDADGDGIGNFSNPTYSCTPIAGTSTTPGDCDDTNPLLYNRAILSLDWTVGLTVQYFVTNGGSTYTGEIFESVFSPGIGSVILCLGDGCVEVAIVTSGITGGTMVTFSEMNAQAQLFNSIEFLSTDGLTTNIGEPAFEICDGLDNNCNGQIDEGLPAVFADNDGDGFGGLVLSCDTPGVAVGGDCDDDDPNVFPGSTIGFNCNGCSAADQLTLASVVFVSNGVALSGPWLQPMLQCGTNCESDPDPDACLTNCFSTALSIGSGCGQCLIDYISQVLPLQGGGSCNATCQANALAQFLQCSGLVDQDGDGYFAPFDCNDQNPAVHPGALEICDGLDNDCNGITDGPLAFADTDGDGFGDPLVNVDCNDPIAVTNSADCDDTDPTAFPGSTVGPTCSACTAADQLYISQNLQVIGDGISGPYATAVLQCSIACQNDGDPQACLSACVFAETGVSTNCSQCMVDYIATIFAAEPSCDASCRANALVDFLSCSGLIDADADGYFHPADCNDQDPAINPGATEICDGIDNDCNGLVDEAGAFRDADGDGFGDLFSPLPCGTPGSVSDNTDCNDSDPTAFPGSTIGEPCPPCTPADQLYIATHQQEIDALLEQAVIYCVNNGQSFSLSCILSYVNSTELVSAECMPCIVARVQCQFQSCGTACLVPPATNCASCTNTFCQANFEACIGLVDVDQDGYYSFQDCDDQNPSIYPFAVEYCDELDNDCNGLVDDNVQLFALYVDADNDGFGDDDAPTIMACPTPPGYVLFGGDCNDSNPNVFPFQLDPCDPPNGIDDDCDGSVDNGNDLDTDGFGTCEGDCDDDNGGIYPGALEICDGIDNDCDGLIDEGFPQQYADNDGDGYGDLLQPLPCDTPGVANADDCDDSNAAVLPGAVELCDGVDNDCNGLVDEGLISCCSDFILEFQSGSTNANAVTYEVLDETGTATVLSGNNPVPANSIGTQTLCLPDGCYQLRVTDAGGDGLAGYVLRETGLNGRRFIDNTGNMSNGVSQISSGGTFCIPMSTDELIWSSCNKLDWVNNKYLVCHSNAAVSAEWIDGGANNVQDANSGYEFWIFDPNGTYSYRKFRSHTVSDGKSPANATRACHMKINNWYNSVLTPLIPQNTLLNVRVRGRVNGTNLAFGPACTMKLDAARAACPLVKLQDDPTNTSDYSCGVTRSFGGTNTGANKITALPPQFSPAPFGGGTGVHFQFRFRIPAEGVCIVLPPQTSPTRYLNWNSTVASPLLCSKTYEVDVRVSKNGGNTWCIGGPVNTACSDGEPWGLLCNVTIDCGGTNFIYPSPSTFAQGSLTLYPNPNRGDQLFVTISSLAPDVDRVTMDLFDLTGKRIASRTLAAQDGLLNAAIDLQGGLDDGLYLVQFKAGTSIWNQRLVIAH